MVKDAKSTIIGGESLLEKVSENIHDHDSSSSSVEPDSKKPVALVVKVKIYQRFGRAKPVHSILVFLVVETGKHMENFSLSL